MCLVYFEYLLWELSNEFVVSRPLNAINTEATVGLKPSNVGRILVLTPALTKQKI